MNRHRFSSSSAKFILVALSVVQVLLPHGPALGAGADDLPTMIVLVRHADKASNPQDDPSLTAAGAKRAQDLAVALGNANLAAIITTQLRRTRETAQPIAAALGLTAEPITLDPEQLDAHIRSVLAALRHRAGSSVLVVGHSTTVPALIEALGGPHLLAICETVYDNLFVLVPTSTRPFLVQSRYGTASATQDCK
jgi:phosphohistidine phosphatase SixA